MLSKRQIIKIVDNRLKKRIYFEVDGMYIDPITKEKIVKFGIEGYPETYLFYINHKKERVSDIFLLSNF